MKKQKAQPREIKSDAVADNAAKAQMAKMLLGRINNNDVICNFINKQSIVRRRDA